MATVNFDELIYALTESIVEAQSLVELNQLSKISKRYFDNDSTPHMLNIKIPSLEQGEQANEYQVPLLSLVPHGNLVIKEATINLDVDIASIDTDGPSEYEKINQEKEKINQEKEKINQEKEKINQEKEEIENELNQIKSTLHELSSGNKTKRELIDELSYLARPQPILCMASYEPHDPNLENDFKNSIEKKERSIKLSVDPSSGGIAAKKGHAAKIELKLGSVDMSEGLARLINDVVKTQGVTVK